MNDIFKEFYPKLLLILPVECLIIQFYAANLLSSANKSKLDGLSTYEAKTKCFLDEVIQPGLKIDYTEQFDEMLAFMVKSDDPPVKFLAKEINKSRGITSPPKIFHGLDHDQLRSQDSNTQGKELYLSCVCNLLLVSVMTNSCPFLLQSRYLASHQLVRLH